MERVAMSTAVVTNEPIVVSFNRLLTSCCKRTRRVSHRLACQPRSVGTMPYARISFASTRSVITNSR